MRKKPARQAERARAESRAGFFRLNFFPLSRIRASVKGDENFFSA
jgi:hypothetical protein